MLAHDTAKPHLPREPRGGNLSRKVTAVAAAVGSMIGAASALLTSFLIVRPNLGPSTEDRAEITKVAAEPDVTLEQYFAHPMVRSALTRLEKTYPDRMRRLMENERPRLRTHGAVIIFEVEMQGLRGMPIAYRWSLFDSDTRKRLAESEDLDPLPLRLSIDKKDLQTAAWEVWIDTSGTAARNCFVRLELYDEERQSWATFTDSGPFPAVAGPTP